MKSNTGAPGRAVVRTRGWSLKDLALVGVTVVVVGGGLLVARELARVGDAAGRSIVSDYVPGIEERRIESAQTSAPASEDEFTTLDDAERGTTFGAASESPEALRVLGPPSDPGRLRDAENGVLDVPTLVWFHADWCHVCQEIKPEVVDLARAFEGRVAFVRINVDHDVSYEALFAYRVRGTPTFVLFERSGDIAAYLPGWPGSEPFAAVFEEMTGVTDPTV